MTPYDIESEQRKARARALVSPVALTTDRPELSGRSEVLGPLPAPGRDAKMAEILGQPTGSSQQQNNTISPSTLQNMKDYISRTEGGTGMPAADGGGYDPSSSFFDFEGGAGIEGGATAGGNTSGIPQLGSFGSRGGSMGSFGPAAAIAAAVALTKGREARSSGTENKLWRMFNAPSFNQIKEDPRQAGMWLGGLGMLSPWLGIGDKGKNTKPEWEALF